MIIVYLPEIEERLDYSEDQPRDKKGRFSSDPTHVRLSVAEKAHLVSTSRAGGDVGKRATEALAMHKKGFHGEARKHLAEIKKTHPVLEVQARGPVPVPALQEHAKGAEDAQWSDKIKELKALRAKQLANGLTKQEGKKYDAIGKEVGVEPAPEPRRPGEEGLSAEEVARRAAVRAAYKDKAAKEKADKLAAVEKAAVAAEKKEAKQQARAAEKAASPSLFGRPRGHTHIVSGDTRPLAEAFKKHGFTWDPVSSTWSGDQESVNKLNRFYNTSGVTSEHINDYMSKRVAENKERAAAPKPAPAPKAVPKPAPATFAPAPKTWFNPKKSYESGSEEAEDASFHGGSYYHGSPGRR